MNLKPICRTLEKVPKQSRRSRSWHQGRFGTTELERLVFERIVESVVEQFYNQRFWNSVPCCRGLKE